MTSINSLNLGKTAKNLSKEKVLKKVTNFKKFVYEFWKSRQQLCFVMFSFQISLPESWAVARTKLILGIRFEARQPW